MCDKELKEFHSPLYILFGDKFIMLNWRIFIPSSIGNWDEERVMGLL